MLIDVNAYIGHWPFKQVKYNTCEALLQRMNKFGVDVSVLSSLNGIFYKNTQSANEELYNEIRSDKKFADRFIPFATLNPVYAAWKDDFKTCITKMGMKGIKLYPHYHDYDLTEAPVIELVKMARDHDIPVAFPIRMVDSRQRSWMDIPKEWLLRDFMPIIREVPDAKYMLLNISIGISLNAADQDLLKKTNYLFDTSGRSLQYLGTYLKTFGKDKFALGTHSPVLDYLSGLLRIESLFDNEASKAEKEMLRSGNAQKFLKI